MAGKRDDERRELEAAGWEPEEREGETVWKNPASGLLYPQGQAVAGYRQGGCGPGGARTGDQGLKAEKQIATQWSPWRARTLLKKTTSNSRAEPTRTVSAIRTS